MPLFHKVDAILLKVADLDHALAFYQGALGQELCWRKPGMAAVRLGDTELVLSTEQDTETDILVESVPDAVALFEHAGGVVLFGPSEIDVGRVAVVQDPFGNKLTLVDLSKGLYQTDNMGNVTGVV